LHKSQQGLRDICATSARQNAPELIEALIMTDDKILSPENCSNMADVRAGVDATDMQLVALLARRFGYMDAAARIKESRDAVRDEMRKAQVIANTKAEAARLGAPVEIIEDLWERLVESSIAHELAKWDEIRR
jgi:isochorismate pyruvate lyase